MAVTVTNGSAGLTPQMAIINADGTPTVFFFRWLLNIGAPQKPEASGISVNGDLAGSPANSPISVNGVTP
jgi:hypothetical protein